MYRRVIVILLLMHLTFANAGQTDAGDTLIFHLSIQQQQLGQFCSEHIPGFLEAFSKAYSQRKAEYAVEIERGKRLVGERAARVGQTAEEFTRAKFGLPIFAVGPESDIQNGCNQFLEELQRSRGAIEAEFLNADRKK